MLRKATLGRLALLSAALIWGSSFVIMKDTVDSVPVFMLLCIRFTVAFLLLGAVFFKRLIRVSKRTIVGGVLCGALLVGAYTAQTFGVMQTTPGKNAFLTSVYCILTPFLSWLCFRRRPTVWNWVAAALCVAGVGFVSLSGDMSLNPGDALTLLGGVFYAVHILVLDHYSERGDPLALTVIQFGATALLTGLASLLTEGGHALPGLDIWPQLAYLSVCCTAVTITFQAVGQKLTPPSQSAILLSFESVFGAFFSLLLGREQLTLQLGCGFLLIFLSVIVSETQLSFLKRQH